MTFNLPEEADKNNYTVTSQAWGKVSSNPLRYFGHDMKNDG